VYKQDNLKTQLALNNVLFVRHVIFQHKNEQLGELEICSTENIFKWSF